MSLCGEFLDLTDVVYRGRKPHRALCGFVSGRQIFPKSKRLRLPKNRARTIRVPGKENFFVRGYHSREHN